MNKQNLENIEKEAEIKAKKREKKKKVKMKVSGANIKKLAQIISKKYKAKIL